jgi:DNA adenine methylase
MTTMVSQTSLFNPVEQHALGVPVEPYTRQLLKWVGNKQKFAYEILSYFPDNFNHYFEPFIGSGGVLATLAPHKGTASDVFKPLIDLWQLVKHSPDSVIDYWKEACKEFHNGNKSGAYSFYQAKFNKEPNGLDLLVLSRTCYGGVVRFRKIDGAMSTPCGVHRPMDPKSFSLRVYEWHERIKNTDFYHSDFEPIIDMAKKGDVIYCDPPYIDSQSILYGAQDFSFERLINSIIKAKFRGALVALSIDGMKKSGTKHLKLPIPPGIFEREVYVHCGRSMLRRFQMTGKTLESELVSDRLLLTW